MSVYRGKVIFYVIDERKFKAFLEELEENERNTPIRDILWKRGIHSIDATNVADTGDKFG